MAGSYNVLDIYDPSKEYLDIYIFSKNVQFETKVWNCEIQPVNPSLWYFELSQTYGFILFFRQWNSSTKVFESYEYTEKDVLPLYRFSIFTLKANKFNARHND